MTFFLKRWFDESAELKKERLTMITKHMSMEELRDYRDNYKKSEKIFNKIVSVCLLFLFGMLAVTLTLMDTGIVKESQTLVGLLLGYMFFTATLLSNGTYVKRIEKEMERRYFEGKE